MALKEQDVVMTTTDASGNTIIQMPITRIENVEGGVKSVNGKTIDSSGNVVDQDWKTVHGWGAGQGITPTLATVFATDDANEVNLTGCYTITNDTANVAFGTSILLHFERTWGAGTSAIQFNPNNSGDLFYRKATGYGSDRVWSNWKSIIHPSLNTASSTSLAVDGTEVTVPFNGMAYVRAHRSGTGSGKINVYIDGKANGNITQGNSSYSCVPFPVAKGQTFRVTNDGLTSLSCTLIAFA